MNVADKERELKIKIDDALYNTGNTKFSIQELKQFLNDLKKDCFALNKEIVEQFYSLNLDSELAKHSLEKEAQYYLGEGIGFSIVIDFLERYLKQEYL